MPGNSTRRASGAIGESGGKFMVNKYVLRRGARAIRLSFARQLLGFFSSGAARRQCNRIRLVRRCRGKEARFPSENH
jgi:hypothetical protein